MIKAVIFDHDGVIFDNEPLASRSYEAIIKSYGKNPIPEKHGLVHPVGQRGDEVWKVLKNKYGIKEHHNVLREKRRKVHLELLRGDLEPMPGLLDLLKTLKNHKIKLAVASGASYLIINTILKKLRVKSFFDVIVTGENSKKSKPDPEPFLITSQKLQIDPNYCLVIEDSEAGVIAAYKAGMKVIAVPTAHSKYGDFSKANKIVSSLQDITWEFLSKI